MPHVARPSLAIASLSVIAFAGTRLTLPAYAAELFAPNAEQSAAAAKMAEAADNEAKSLVELEKIRARTPEFLELKLEWSRRALASHLLSNPSATDRKKLLDAYAERARETAAAIAARQGLDATQADIHAAGYAAAQAAAFQAGVQPQLDSQSSMPAPALLSKEQIAASQVMLKEAQATIAGLEEIEDIHPRTPEFMELKQSWRRRLLAAQLQTLADASDRKAAAQSYLVITQLMETRIGQRTELDGPASIHAARYAVAEAEFTSASLNAPVATAELTPAQRSAAEKMLAEAKLFIEGIIDIEDIRPRTPEFLQLKLDAFRREFDAQMLLAKGTERDQALNAYIQRLDRSYQLLLQRSAGIPPAALFPIQFARAQADYLKASLK